MDIFTQVTLVFIVAKLWGVIGWPWYAVFAPTFVEFGLLLLIGFMRVVLKDSK